MQTRDYLIRCAVFLVVLLCAAQGQAEPDTQRQALSKVLDQTKMYTLSNGVRVVFYRRGFAPVFAGAIAVRVGGTDEKLGQTGISHMLEHMAFKGTPEIGTTDYAAERKLLEAQEEIIAQTDPAQGFSPEQAKRWAEIDAELQKLWVTSAFVREYEKRGVTGLNATTDAELTQYFVNLPRQSFEFWCQAEAGRILNPVMRQFYKERDVVMEERRMRTDDSPTGRLYEQMLQVAFLKHPYRNPVIGYDFDIRGLTATQVAEFHSAYYVAKNIVISLVGDVNPEDDLVLLEKYFGRIPSSQMPARPTIIEPEPQGERQLTIEARASPELFIAYPKPIYPHPDDPPLSVMFKMFSGSSISPLYQDLVKRRRLATDVGYVEAPGAAYPNLVIFTLSAKAPHSNSELLAAFDHQLKGFSKLRNTEELMKVAKRSFSMEHLSHLNSNLELARSFAASELLYGNWRAIIDWYDKAMAVTVEDISRVTNQYLRPSRRTIARLETLEDKK